TRTETVKLFGFLPVGTKQVIDQDATNAAVSAANHFAQAFASTLSSADFSVDFDTAVDDLINEAIVAEFMQSTRVEEVLAKVRELIEAGDYEAARAHWAALKSDAALLNAELVDTAEAAKRAADELQQVHLATASYQRDLREFQVSRAWEDGTMSLREYQQELSIMERARVKDEFSEAWHDLMEAQQDALDAGDMSLYNALKPHEEPLMQWYTTLLADTGRAASEEIKQILGTTFDDVAGGLRSAFDASTTEDFREAWGTNLLNTTRSALITAFMESEAMKPLLNNISDVI